MPSPLEEVRSLIAKGDMDPAMQKLMEFLNGDFYNDEALFMLGGCFMSKGLNGLGAVVTSAAIDARGAEKKPFPEALMNLGSAYKAEHQNETALRIWQDALKHETVPRERSKLLTNIAGLYVNEGNPAEAIKWCDLAIAEDPRNSGARGQRGFACLELGRWKEGWEGWLHTYGHGDRHKRVYRDIPEWDGKTEGKAVIVYGDQGVGDEIYFASCLPDLRKVCKHIIFDCHPRLERLFKRSFPDFTVHGTRKDLSRLEWVEDSGADAVYCLSDLPGLFRNTNEDWGNGSAYLKAPSAVRTGRGPRIGISWTGGTKRTRTDLRSVSLNAMEPIFRSLPDAQWFSLQYTPDAAREVCHLEEETGIRISHFPGWVEHYDYDRTASFVASLDLVITVCTTIHHLGGALGVPTWTLVPSRPSWRYQLRGDRVPWYNSARMFRQTSDGDWSGLIERVAGELENFAGVPEAQRRVA